MLILKVHLVSEHVWCEDYLVRNFFLKNLETSQTRTVTQFHFLTWTESGNPQNVKTVLDFRRCDSIFLIYFLIFLVRSFACYKSNLHMEEDNGLLNIKLLISFCDFVI